MTTARDTLQQTLGTAYRLERELGRGGMATVYLAEDVRHRRRVAIKVLHPELSAILGPDRFLKEIELTANLQHPHILPLFDSGSAGGQLYYVMPFIEGETLRARLERERQLPVAEALRIAAEVADALDYAHRHRVVHRDVKPENILLAGGSPRDSAGRFGEARVAHALVADFGIALAVEQAGGVRMTQTGISLGTPHYMAPEQAMGEKAVDHRADVYALGAVTYEMLVGQPPFPGPNAQSIVAKVLTERPTRPSVARDTVPPHVDDAILKALEKLPADRFDTAAAFAAALADTDARGAPGVARTRGTAAGRRLTSLLPWGIAAAAIVAAALATRRAAGTAPPTWQTTLLGDSARVPADEPAMSISPDGSMLVFETEGQDNALRLKRRGELTASAIPGTEHAHNPTFSPDGKWIAFISDGHLRKVPVTGGRAVALADIVESRGIVWADDGSIVYTALVPPSLRRVSSDGGPASALLPDSVFGGLGTATVTVLPGSRALLLVLCTAQCSVMSLNGVDLRTGRRKAILDDVAQAWYLDDGQLLYVRSDGALMLAPFNADRLELTGPPRPVADAVSVGAGFAQLAWSRSGTLAFVRAEADRGLRRVVRVDSAGQLSSVDPAWSGPFHMLALAPDGRRLALWSGAAALDQNIWVKELDTGPFMRLTFGGTDRRPAWGPDGKRIAFIRDTLGNSVVMVRNTDGSGGEQLVARLDRRVQEIAWSPDASWLILRTDNGARGMGDLVGVRTAGDTTPVPVVATPFTELNPMISPDGHWLAYTSNESGKNEVYVRPFPETRAGRWQVSLSGGSQPLWSRDGRRLYYLDTDRRLIAAAVTTSTTFGVAARHPLFDASLFTTEAFQRSYDVSPDGRFVFLAPLGSADPNAPSRVVWADNWMRGLAARR
jgi:serine/threonine-protein kinase